MIVSIQGQLVSATPLHAVIETGGLAVFYALAVLNKG